MSERDVIWVDAAGRSTRQPRTGTNPFVPLSRLQEKEAELENARQAFKDTSNHLLDAVTRINRLELTVSRIASFIKNGDPVGGPDGDPYGEPESQELTVEDAFWTANTAIEMCRAALAANGEG